MEGRPRDPVDAYIQFVWKLVPLGALVAAVAIAGLVLGFLPEDVAAGLISVGVGSVVVVMAAMPRLRRQAEGMRRRRGDGLSQ